MAKSTGKSRLFGVLAIVLVIVLVMGACSSGNANNSNNGQQSPSGGSGNGQGAGNGGNSGQGGNGQDGNGEGNGAGNGEASAGKIVEEFRFPLSLTFASLDPHLVPTGGVANIDRHIYEQLVAFNTKYEPVPVLAESVELSEDGKTYTFPLRKGIKFHNGKELKAEDVVASLNRWKEKTPRVQASFGESVFVEVDPYTVSITLDQPSNDVPLQLASYLQFSAITTKEIIEAAGPDGITEFVGTGPYKFVEYKQDQYVHLAKFEDYQSPEGEPDGVVGRKEALINNLYFDLISDNSTAFNAFLAEDYDFTAVSIDNLPQVNSLSEITLIKDFASELNIVFNKRAPITSNVKFREAVAAALDMEQILLGYTSDPELYKLNPSLVQQDNAEWYSEKGSEVYNQANVKKAKQLLAESGYNGEELVFLTTRDSGGAFYNGTILVQDQLEKIGLNIKLDVYDFTTMIARRGDPELWDVYVGSFSTQPSPSQVLFFGKTYGWPEDEQLQQLIRNTTAALTKEEKKAASDALHEYEWKYLAAVKIGDTGRYYAIRNNVVGFRYFEGPILWNTTIEE